MDQDKFKEIYGESRNGANSFHFHPLYPKFQYSDGVRNLANTGCFWLLDILGTELTPALFSKNETNLCCIKVTVADQQAEIVGEFHDDDADNNYRRSIDFTDLPDGEWMLYISYDQIGTMHCILPSEY